MEKTNATAELIAAGKVVVTVDGEGKRVASLETAPGSVLALVRQGMPVRVIFEETPGGTVGQIRLVR